MLEWLLTLLFGTGATLTSTPIDIGTGEKFLVAPHALKPVSDSMRVGLAIGKATAASKSAVLSGKLKLSDLGNVKVSVCRNKEDCVELRPSGTFFSEKSYGFGFAGSGPSFQGHSFVGVKISTDQPLESVVVSWSNFVQ